MSYKFDECIEKRQLVKIEASQALIVKELNAAEIDLLTAKSTFDLENFKWATVQAYYGMFHAARALVMSKGYREKSHYCLLIALKELFVSKGVLEKRHLDNFDIAMDLREEADYGLVYSEESASKVIENAESFLKEAKRILNA